jgi:2-polyprenyl-3-methyl-5-hydroxy-6-metoxy-1,4-benzoquinol methylase
MRQFFKAQGGESNLDFEDVVCQIYLQPYYAIAEHLIYAFPYGQKRAEAVLSMCARAIEGRGGGTRILDVGSGPGVIARELGRRFPESSITLLDVSSACLDYSRKVVSNDGCYRFIQANFLDMLEGDYFDLVVASEVVEHVEDPHAAMHKLRSLVCPGGALVLGVPIQLPMTMHLVDRI